MGLLNLARQGRNGDTRVAHLTPGEVVIPREVAAVRPDLVRGVGQQYSQMGGNPNTLRVGHGKINPRTGIEEFATEAEVQALYQNNLGRAADADGLKYWMGKTDINELNTEFVKAAAPEIKNNAQNMVDTSYNQLFGRDAEADGGSYWSGQVKSGAITSYADLQSKMKASAQGDDIKALYDKAQYPTSWDKSIDPNAGTLYYDAAKDKWLDPKKKTQENPSGLTYTPNFTSAVDAPTETIEGRIKNLLDANNPVIRQAGERVMGQFAQRGIPNSSMAIEAANEAMISKAIEIAGPDAQRYYTNRRENVDWNNKFAQQDQSHQYDLENQKTAATLNQETYAKNSDVSQKNTLQQNYLAYVASSNNVMAQQIAAIQAADMSPDAKTSQIAEIQMVFSNAMTTFKETFKKMPAWKDEWAALAPEIGG